MAADKALTAERRPARLENLTLWQRVYEYLREEILSERLQPGTELQEVALSEELGVSRGPIREAIGRLAAAGAATPPPPPRPPPPSPPPDEVPGVHPGAEAPPGVAAGSPPPHPQARPPG